MGKLGFGVNLNKVEQEDNIPKINDVDQPIGAERASHNCISLLNGRGYFL